MKSLIKALRGKHTLIFVDFEGTQFSHEIIASGLCKCKIDDEGHIIDFDKEGLLLYTKPRSSIGKYVTEMTSLTEDYIKEHGEPWGETIKHIEKYIGEDKDDYLFVCFGSNDIKMVVESNRFSHPENVDVAKEWVNNFFDFMSFASQYIRDEKGNTYSLVNFLKVFNDTPTGVSHDPLNDAKDLLKMYDGFIKNPDIVFEQYTHHLTQVKVYPAPVRDVINKLSNGETVTHEEFLEIVKSYLS